MTNDDVDTVLTLYKRQTALIRRYKKLLMTIDPEELLHRLFEPYFIKYSFIHAVSWYQWFDEHDEFHVDDVCLAGIPAGFSYTPITIISWVHSVATGFENEAYNDNFSGVVPRQVEDLVCDTDFYEDWLFASKDYLGLALGGGDVVLTRTGEFALND